MTDLGGEAEAEKRRLRKRRAGTELWLGRWGEEQGEVGHTGTGTDREMERETAKQGGGQGKERRGALAWRQGGPFLPAGAWTGRRGKAQAGGPCGQVSASRGDMRSGSVSSAKDRALDALVCRRPPEAPSRPRVGTRCPGIVSCRGNVGIVVRTLQVGKLQLSRVSLPARAGLGSDWGCPARSPHWLPTEQEITLWSGRRCAHFSL